jgi:cytoskeletal protein CcmA (bactofilin family)
LELIEVSRQTRQHFVVYIRIGSGFAHRASHEGSFSAENRRMKDRKMADQADDLSTPMTPARPVVPPPPRAPDLSRPGGGPSHPPTSLNQQTDQPLVSRDNEVEARKLIVGRGTSLSGEITSCDRLVIEGSVEANLQNCRHLAITETGLFNGNAAIDDVEVSGRFEGDLVVGKRLLIRASGHVSGTITYGEIEIEAGGKISGVIQTHAGPKGLRTIAASLPHGTPNGADDGHRSDHGSTLGNSRSEGSAEAVRR